MAKSKIIKELANSCIDTATALKRLKILLVNLNKPELNAWVNNELNGYKNDDEVPEYRKFHGEVIANFIVGNAYKMMKYQNTPLPTANLSEEVQGVIEKVIFREGISAIKRMEGSDLGQGIPPEMYRELTRGTNISSITSANIRVSHMAPTEIIASVETRILEILCILEKEFGVLDELDIECADKSEQEIEEVCQKILNVIYVDKSIAIGDGNKINKSNIHT